MVDKTLSKSTYLFIHWHNNYDLVNLCECQWWILQHTNVVAGTCHKDQIPNITGSDASLAYLSLLLLSIDFAFQAQMVSFQCSPLATAEGIQSMFRQCARYQKNKNMDAFVSVVVLDEVGLAEDSPKTQRTASITLDFPQPFGPTIPTIVDGRDKVVGSTKVLKPESFILLNRIKKLKKYHWLV